MASRGDFFTCGLDNVGLCRSLSPPHDCWMHRKPLQYADCTLLHCLPLNTQKGVCVFARPCATDCVCVRLCLHVCARARLRGASAWMRVRPGMCARPACVLVYVCGISCVRIRVRTRGCAAQACTTQGYSWDAPLVLAGYQRYSESTRWGTRWGTQDPVEGYSRRTHAHDVLWGT